MAVELLPPLGASGEWSLKDPFADKLVSGVAYECKEIRKLSAVIGSGVDAFAEYYDKYGISQDIFNQHTAADYSVVTLVSSEGNWLFVPTPYINGWPSNDSVKYVVMGAAVTLGALPQTYDPSFLREKIVNLLSSTVGLTPTVQFVTISEVTTKPYDQHLAYDNARKVQITDSNTDYARRVKAETDLIAAQETIRTLQQFIINSGLAPVTPSP